MRDTKLYSNLCESIYKAKIAYVCWDGKLSLTDEIILLIKKSITNYKFRIAFITKSAISKDEVYNALQNSDLLPYQINRIEFIPLAELDSIRDKGRDFDMIIPYKLESYLTVDDIDLIVNNVRSATYLCPKVIFMSREEDSFIKQAVERFGESSFISIMRRLKDTNKAKFILHECHLDNENRIYNYTINRSMIERPVVINEDYPSYMTKINSYYNRVDAIIYVKCTQKEFYQLIINDIAYYKDKIKSLISGPSCDKYRGYLRDVIKRRRKFLSGIKNDLIKEFFAQNPDKKRLIFCSDKSQAECLASDNIISIKQEKGVNEDLALKYNNGAIQNLGVIGILPDNLTFDSTEEVIFPYLNGIEDDILMEIDAVNLDIKAHIFYFIHTIEEDNLLSIADSFDEDLFIYYDEFIKS